MKTKFALCNGERIEAIKGAKGICDICGAEMIAKCGEIKIHHWAHKTECTDHWWENETEWHRNWKDEFPNEWQEVVLKAESGEKHKADVKTNTGWTIEFQHSAISREERNSRDHFYNKLIWVIDGARRKTDIKQFERLVDRARYISKEPLILRVIGSWALERFRLNHEWGDSKSLVLLDFGESEVNYLNKYSSNKDLWLIYPSKNKTYVCSFSKDYFIEVMSNTRLDVVYQMLLYSIETKLREVDAQEEKRIRTLAKPIRDGIAYIIGILRNRKKQDEWFDEFDEFDIKVALRILNNYVKADIRQGYSDDYIVKNSLSSLKSHAIGQHKWTAWKDAMERFTRDKEK